MTDLEQAEAVVTGLREFRPGERVCVNGVGSHQNWIGCIVDRHNADIWNVRRAVQYGGGTWYVPESYMEHID